MAWIGDRERKTGAGMAIEAGYVNEIAGKMARRGLRTALHNHDVELYENAGEWR